MFTIHKSLYTIPTTLNIMEKNKLKLRIFNMFQSSYASCTSKNTNNDVLDKKPQNLQDYNKFIEILSLKQPFSYICKPKKLQEISQTQEKFKLNIKFPPRSKITKFKHLLHPAENDIDCLKCPPLIPPNSFRCRKKNKPKKNKMTKTRKSRSRSKTFNILDFQGFSYNGLFSSDEESEDEHKISYVSSQSYKRNNYGKPQKSLRSCRRNRGANKGIKTPSHIGCLRNMDPHGLLTKDDEKKGLLSLKGSFAVVKSSSDPYNDFKASMVEIIVAKSILSAEELEDMLHCFLSLNSNCHHRIIVQVFKEIWEALFSSSSFDMV